MQSTWVPSIVEPYFWTTWLSWNVALGKAINLNLSQFLCKNLYYYSFIAQTLWVALVNILKVKFSINGLPNTNQVLAHDGNFQLSLSYRRGDTRLLLKTDVSNKTPPKRKSLYAAKGRRIKLAKIITIKKLCSSKKIIGENSRDLDSLVHILPKLVFYCTSEAHDYDDISTAELTWPTFCKVNRLLLIKLSMGWT